MRPRKKQPGLDILPEVPLLPKPEERPRLLDAALGLSQRSRGAWDNVNERNALTESTTTLEDLVAFLNAHPKIGDALPHYVGLVKLIADFGQYLDDNEKFLLPKLTHPNWQETPDEWAAEARAWLAEQLRILQLCRRKNAAKWRLGAAIHFLCRWNNQVTGSQSDPKRQFAA